MMSPKSIEPSPFVSLAMGEPARDSVVALTARIDEAMAWRQSPGGERAKRALENQDE